MDSEQQQYQHHFQDFPRQFHQQKQQTNGLTRFRSAPSSYFASFLDAAADTVTVTATATATAIGGVTGGVGGERRDFPAARPLSPETESIFARFMNSIGEEDNSSQKLSNIPENVAVQPEFTARVKQETDIQQQLQHQQQQQHQDNYNNQSQMMYHSQSKPPLSNHHNTAVSSAMQNTFRAAAASSMGIDSIPHMKTGIGGGINNSNSGLTRHSSSPAGFFANLNIDTTGYGMMGGMRNYGGSNVQVNYSSGQPASTSELVNQNSDVGAKRLRMNSLHETKFSNSGNNPNDDSNYDFPMNSWDDSILSENFSGLDRVADEDIKVFPELNASENQSGEIKNRPLPLTHHLSLPKTLPELSNMERFLQGFQDSTPLRIRAKRGCATHPRSIAERVRRTRISERMRKLQDLVPNMDKQTNTADMLDLAVDYIKDLQKHVENLADNRAKCTCSR